MEEKKNKIELIGVKKDELSTGILLGFHKQFAENQIAREQSFLKILGFLGAVIFGYAFVYKNYSDSIDQFSYVAIVCEIVLTFGAFVIITLAYNFRRDQFINSKIRRYCEILGEKKIFPENYDPSVSLKSWWRVINWMPNFLGVFFIIFPIFQILIFVSYKTKLNMILNCSNPNPYMTAVTISFWVLLISIIFVTVYYFNQLRKIMGLKENNTQPQERTQKTKGDANES